MVMSLILGKDSEPVAAKRRKYAEGFARLEAAYVGTGESDQFSHTDSENELTPGVGAKDQHFEVCS